MFIRINLVFLNSYKLGGKVENKDSNYTHIMHYLICGNMTNVLQSTAKLFEHLRLFMSKNSYLMEFYEINICQFMVSKLYTAYNKNEMTKNSNQTKEISHILPQVLE